LHIDAAIMKTTGWRKLSISRSSSSSKFDNREIVILKGLTQLTNELLDACLCLVLTDK
ncbi:hypothetical protein T4C_3347, partial [Trichinella pseudospiralis]